MASALSQVVEEIQLNDYGSLIIIIAVGYDYILTFPDEIEYIWNKPWTSVSTLFLAVRYLGLCNVILESLLGSSFLPGPAKLFKGTSFDLLGNWTEMIFVAAADLSMILRVWALYKRSNLILGALLTLCAIEVIPYLIFCILISAQKQLIEATVQILDYSFCAVPSSPLYWLKIIIIPQITLGALMCLLIVVQFIRELFQMYKATKQLRLNHFTNLLVREGLIYFLAILTHALMNLLIETGTIPTNGWWLILLGALLYIPPYTLVPRLILNLRKLYARSLQGGFGSEIDTAFGLGSGFGLGAAGSAIAFADAGQNEEDENQEEGVQMAD